VRLSPPMERWVVKPGGERWFCGGRVVIACPPSVCPSGSGRTRRKARLHVCLDPESRCWRVGQGLGRGRGGVGRGLRLPSGCFCVVRSGEPPGSRGLSRSGGLGPTGYPSFELPSSFGPVTPGGSGCGLKPALTCVCTFSPAVWTGGGGVVCVWGCACMVAPPLSYTWRALGSPRRAVVGVASAIPVRTVSHGRGCSRP
jgi:hypothetical protein